MNKQKVKIRVDEYLHCKEEKYLSYLVCIEKGMVENMQNKNIEADFSYTYSAKEQDEIKRIREKYQPKGEDNISRLRKLDAMVTQKATVDSLIIGVIGALIMGCGMSFVMTDLGTVLGLQGKMNMVIGILIGLLGMVLAGAAYPVYSKVLKEERKKAAPEILRLTEELIK